MILLLLNSKTTAAALNTSVMSYVICHTIIRHTSSYVICHMSCHMSYVICHMSYVCHLSNVICHTPS